MRYFVACMLVFLVSPLFVPQLFATPLQDPGIPDGETARYRIEQQNETWEFVERVNITDDRSSYRFEFEEPDESTTVLVDRNGMYPYAVESISIGGNLEILSTTHLRITERAEHEEIKLLSFSELKYLLRGYPFDSAPDIDISFFSTGEDEGGGPDFSIKVRYRGTETLRIGTRSIETHRLEIRFSTSGVFRVLGALIPKTFYWYSAEAPHYLVAYEGSSGFPGSPKQRIEIRDYSGW